MTPQSETDDETTALVWELVDELAVTGTLRPRPERRELLVRALDGLLACEPERFLRHLAWLKGVQDSLCETIEGKRKGRALTEVFGREKEDIPDNEIRVRGFDAASDQLLVDTVVSPQALGAVYAALRHPVDPPFRNV